MPKPDNVIVVYPHDPNFGPVAWSLSDELIRRMNRIAHEHKTKEEQDESQENLKRAGAAMITQTLGLFAEALARDPDPAKLRDYARSILQLAPGLTLNDEVIDQWLENN